MAQQMNVTRSDPRATGASLGAAGSLAGLAGGLAMAAYLVVAAVAQDLDPFTALESMGATFRDASAAPRGVTAVMFGVTLHLAVSALIGLLFASALPRDFPPLNAALVCVGFAFAAMGVMTSCVVPSANPVLEESFHGQGGSWVIAHALYGFTSGYVCQRLRQGIAARAVQCPRETAA